MPDIPEKGSRDQRIQALISLRGSVPVLMPPQKELFSLIHPLLKNIIAYSTKNHNDFARSYRIIQNSLNQKRDRLANADPIPWKFSYFSKEGPENSPVRIEARFRQVSFLSQKELFHAYSYQTLQKQELPFREWRRACRPETISAILRKIHTAFCPPIFSPTGQGLYSPSRCRMSFSHSPLYL